MNHIYGNKIPKFSMNGCVVVQYSVTPAPNLPPAPNSDIFLTMPQRESYPLKASVAIHAQGTRQPFFSVGLLALSAGYSHCNNI
jgi:hypothetical protein